MGFSCGSSTFVSAPPGLRTWSAFATSTFRGTVLWSANVGCQEIDRDHTTYGHASKC